MISSVIDRSTNRSPAMPSYRLKSSGRPNRTPGRGRRCGIRCPVGWIMSVLIIAHGNDRHAALPAPSERRRSYPGTAGRPGIGFPRDRCRAGGPRAGCERRCPEPPSPRRHPRGLPAPDQRRGRIRATTDPSGPVSVKYSDLARKVTRRGTITRHEERVGKGQVVAGENCWRPYWARYPRPPSRGAISCAGAGRRRHISGNRRARATASRSTVSCHRAAPGAAGAPE